MALVSVKKFSELCGVSRQAIEKAMKAGYINFIVKDKRNMIETTDKKNTLFKKKTKAEYNVLTTDIVPNKIISKEIKTAEDALEVYMVSRAQKTRAQAMKAEMQNEILRGKYISTDLVDLMVFSFLDKIVDNVRRTGNTHLDDASKKILKEGKLTNKIRDEFNTKIANLILDAKEDIKKRILEMQKQEQENLK